MLSANDAIGSAPARSLANTYPSGPNWAMSSLPFCMARTSAE